MSMAYARGVPVERVRNLHAECLGKKGSGSAKMNGDSKIKGSPLEASTPQEFWRRTTHKLTAPARDFAGSHARAPFLKPIAENAQEGQNGESKLSCAR